MREDGRSHNEARNIDIRFGELSSFDGSAWISQGETSVLCAVNGPLPTKSFQEDHTKAVIQVNVRRAASIPQGGGASRFMAQYFRDETMQQDGRVQRHVLEMCKLAIELEQFPLCLIHVQIIIVKEDGGLLAAVTNALMGALLSAALPCRTTICAVNILVQRRQLLHTNKGKTEVPTTTTTTTAALGTKTTTELWVDPTQSEEKEGVATGGVTASRSGNSKDGEGKCDRDHSELPVVYTGKEGVSMVALGTFVYAFPCCSSAVEKKKEEGTTNSSAVSYPLRKDEEEEEEAEEGEKVELIPMVYGQYITTKDMMGIKKEDGKTEQQFYLSSLLQLNEISAMERSGVPFAHILFTLLRKCVAALHGVDLDSLLQLNAEKKKNEVLHADGQVAWSGGKKEVNNNIRSLPVGKGGRVKRDRGGEAPQPYPSRDTGSRLGDRKEDSDDMEEILV